MTAALEAEVKAVRGFLYAAAFQQHAPASGPPFWPLATVEPELALGRSLGVPQLRKTA